MNTSKKITRSVLASQKKREHEIETHDRHFRVVKIQNLAGNDMMMTLFIEYNRENVDAIELLVRTINDIGVWFVNDRVFVTRKQIIDFLESPLANIYGASCYTGHYDVEASYLLEGKFSMPNFYELGSDLQDLWEKSVLKDTKHVVWKDICEKITEL